MKQLKDLNAEVLSAKEMGSINGGLSLNAGSNLLKNTSCSYTFIWGKEAAVKSTCSYTFEWKK